MGTRADFYIGRGQGSEWIGSVAWDGYPGGIDDAVLNSLTQEDFKYNLSKMAERRDDFTSPENGWPWPWNDSGTTDYSYALDEGVVWASCFGSEWFDPLNDMPEDLQEDKAIFPDMIKISKPTFGKRSGVMLIG